MRIKVNALPWPLKWAKNDVVCGASSFTPLQLEVLEEEGEVSSSRAPQAHFSALYPFFFLGSALV